MKAVHPLASPCRTWASQLSSLVRLPRFCCRFVKDFSAADVVMSFVVELTGDRFGLSDYPHLQKYLATVHERPAYKRAEEKGGKLELVS